MKTFIAFGCAIFAFFGLCAPAVAQQSITVNITFSDDQWGALTNKLARVNAARGLEYTNVTLAEWNIECIKADTLKQPRPAAPDPFIAATPASYIASFATNYVERTTRAELTQADRDAAKSVIDGIHPAKLLKAIQALKSVQ